MRPVDPDTRRHLGYDEASARERLRRGAAAAEVQARAASHRIQTEAGYLCLDPKCEIEHWHGGPSGRPRVDYVLVALDELPRFVQQRAHDKGITH